MQIKKISFACCFLFSVLVANGQMFERGKKNFFIEPEASINFSNYKKGAYTGNKFATSFGFSGGKVFSGFLKTGLVYRYDQHIIGKYDSVALNYSTLQNQYAGIKADLMIPFLQFNLGKSNKYECTSLTNYLFLGPEFGFNFASTKTAYTISSTNFLLNASWAFLFKKSGSRKKQAGNDVYVALNMKKSFSSFAKDSFNGQKFYSTYWGLSIVWIHFKTGNWLR